MESRQPTPLTAEQVLALYHIQKYVAAPGALMYLLHEHSLADALDMITSSFDFVFDRLLELIRNRDYNNFVQTIEKHHFDVNFWRPDSCTTLLHFIIDEDTRAVSKPLNKSTKCLCDMAEYLLKKGANIDEVVHSYYYRSKKPTVRELLQQYECTQAEGLTSYLYYRCSLWASPPAQGNHIFPVIREHLLRMEKEDRLQPAV